MRNPIDPLADEARHRTVALRDGIGATAGIRQGRDLRFDRLVATAPALVVVHAGSKTVLTGEGAATIHPGDAVLFMPGLVFDVINRPPPGGDYRARILTWDEALMADHATPEDGGAPRLLQSLRDPGADFVGAFERAAAAIAAPEGVPQAIARHRVGELLLWLSSKGVRFPRETAASPTVRLRRLFLGDLAGDWTVARAAALMAIGESTLRRRLAEEGTCFGDLLVDTRMTQAMNAILTTSLPIDRIALDVGYTSASRFAVRFRARFACAPSELRGHRRAVAPRPKFVAVGDDGGDGSTVAPSPSSSFPLYSGPVWTNFRLGKRTKQPV